MSFVKVLISIIKFSELIHIKHSRPSMVFFKIIFQISLTQVAFLPTEETSSTKQELLVASK